MLSGPIAEEVLPYEKAPVHPGRGPADADCRRPCAQDSLAAAGYVSIKELRETLPQRWTGEYVVENGAYKQLEKGDTVSVDVPIVVPEVDAVPVVRITWEPPIEGLDESFYISGNGWYSKGIGRNFPMEEMAFPLMEEKTTFDPELPWEDAPGHCH